ncbi:MAG: 23S rRNA (adenine(2503)-C(2))-methyltransferase RlmN, partial [Coriobacteriaceae bacterium]|nr:23S rRNA (adenine(2503)-C(2))-methyltransferase RlmN [Coriobacteriaceae bacterium]
RIVEEQISADGTRKYLFELADGVCVEGVGIPDTHTEQLTVCFSTQAGCAIGCLFCATGRGGFVRNLHPGEIFDQVALIGENFGRRVSGAVAMGQGEPFANYDALVEALEHMNSPHGLEIGARHITVSTSGLTERIERFGDLDKQYTLAVSLHAAVQETRDLLMPGLKHETLNNLKATLKDYRERGGRRLSLEYAPIAGLNDDEKHRDALIDFCQGLLCHVNLIPLNPAGGLPETSDTDLRLEPSPRLEDMRQALESNGIEVSVRRSRGADIDGACGQLTQRRRNSEPRR